MPLPTRLLHTIVYESALHLCEGVSTPTSLSVAILMRYGEWDQIATKRVDPRQYLDARSYRLDVAAVDYLRKLEDLPTSFDREEKAVETFFECERSCFRTNERLSPFLFGSYGDEDGVVMEVILRARKNLRLILGPVPQEEFDHSLKEWKRSPLTGRFGPGATYGDRGSLVTVPDKMSSRPTLTTSAMGFLFPWSCTAWASACATDGRSPTFVSGNRFTTVPKDSSKYRGIAVEPSINLFYQLGIGRLLKARLSRSGINLKTGQTTHRRIACEASIRGHMSTIDLSNASDTVCRNLVKLLLPPKWYDLLDSLRSPTTEVGGKSIRLEKFSSMGNGFTFELETLLFLSLCSAAMEACGVTPVPGVNVFVYGDDIIVPTECTREVISTLHFFGFTPNESKTFVDGSFRESCGGDFFLGEDVRPYQLKESPYEPQHLIAMANGLRRLVSSNHDASVNSSPIRRAWYSVLHALPADISRLRGPKDLGDLCVHDDEENWRPRWKDSIRYFKCYRPVSFRRIGWNYWKDDVVLAAAVYRTGDGLLGITPRDAVTGYGFSWVPCS